MKKKIKLLTLDVDGVLTDGGIYLTEKGDIFKKFNVKDGVGIRQAVKAGITVGFISAGKSKNILNARAKMLGVKYVYAGDEQKLLVLDRICKKMRIHFDEVAHIGDDINDLKILSAVGLSACPSNSDKEVKKIVDVILKKRGGDGCVREFIDRHIL